MARPTEPCNVQRPGVVRVVHLCHGGTTRPARPTGDLPASEVDPGIVSGQISAPGLPREAMSPPPCSHIGGVVAAAEPPFDARVNPANAALHGRKRTTETFLRQDADFP
jgi:hypothetical protein